MSVTAFTRLCASLALSIPLNRYRRMLGTVGMFDGLCAIATVVAFKLCLFFDAEKKSYEVFYSDAAAFFAAIVRSILIASWYMGMRRGGWVVFGVSTPLILFIYYYFLVILHAFLPHISLLLTHF